MQLSEAQVTLTWDISRVNEAMAAAMAAMETLGLRLARAIDDQMRSLRAAFPYWFDSAAYVWAGIPLEAGRGSGRAQPQR